MNIVFLGPQSSGKGTQAGLLSREFSIPVLSVGDILREKKARHDEEGRQIASFIDKGLFAPDELVDKLVSEELGADKYNQGVILDGYPRNTHQAEELQKFLNVDKVIFLDVPDAVVMQRMLSRRVCDECGENYNLDSRPPKAEGVCDQCGGKLVPRHDDTKEAIAMRLNIYHEQTKPLIDYYKNLGKLISVDGRGTIEEVHQKIVALLH